VAFGILNFIHPDGTNRLQLAMLQAKLDHVFDSVTNLFPGSMERLGGFFPRQFPRPAGQEQHVGFGQLMFSITPGNFLHHHAATAAVDAPHPVQQEDQKTPERNELEPAQEK
jgi:hypothetical protein